MFPIRLSGTSLLAALLLANPALANPRGGTVTAGSASINATTPQRLDVVQTSDKAIINWKNFSIDNGEHTNFSQPSASSITLNRVTGAQASQLDGKLTANGTVMLVNPNGVLIGPNGRIDVGGLIATTANIRDRDFMAGKLDFDQPSLNRDARVANAGHITVRNQGLAALVAPRVQNSGVIEAKLGRVALGGARTFKLDFQGDGLLSFSVGSQVNETPRDDDGKPAKALVENTGRINADGGTVLIAASAVKNVVDKVINTDGVVEARSIGGHDGRIVLSGGDNGAIQVAGTLDASSADGKGGIVKVDGERIQVTDGAQLDASGAHGGGTINIGGSDIHGAVADRVDVARNARIKADAIEDGNGGNATVLSASHTRFEGHISARGGERGGDGGNVEVSSRDQLQMGGDVDLRAPRGKTGQLLLDPTTITITDAGSGGTLDGNAGDGTVNGGDSDSGGNTISRGLLEGLAATSNITLEASGLITVNAMSGNLINLQTDANHSFTLRSTTSGGIRFLDANTEIRTNGGDITLQALGSGALTNIGKLTSNGGDIALTAGGAVQIANLINAGAGNVAVASLTNSIQSTVAGNLAGNRVAVNAAYGNIGAVGAPVRTNTANLALSTGGNLLLANDATLSSLAITSVHTMNQPFAFEIASPQLTFNVTDSGTVYTLGNVSNTAPLDFTFNGDRGIVVGTIGAVSGNVSLTAPAAIADDGDPLTGITAQNLVLNAQGAIGSAQNALTTAVATLDARGRGGVYLDNTGPLNLLVLSNDASARITSTGTITLNTIASPTLDLTSSGGSIVSANGESIASGTLNLTAGNGSIGSIATPINTVATTMSANTTGDVYINAATSLALNNSSAGGQVVINALNGSMTLAALNAGAGDVVLNALFGSITGASGNLVTANTLNFTTSASGSVALTTAVGTVTGTAGSGGITLTQTGAMAIPSLTTTGTLAINASGGDITVGAIKAGSNASITTADGNIFDDGNLNTEIEAGAIALSALLKNLGTSSVHLRTKATGLTLSTGGNLFIDNDVPISTLIITSVHPTAGARTFTVNVPYLAFNVVDTGSQYTINEITGLTLNTLSFTGDQNFVVGRVHAKGSATIAATLGDIRNDSDANTRIAGASVTLRSDHGSVGVAGANGQMDVDTSNLSVGTAGNMYINDISDLSQLTFTSTHEVPAANYQYVLVAPSLTFNVTDSNAGYDVANISDVTGLTLQFSGDRNITAHTVDLTRNGSLTLTSTNGSLIDDGDKTTRLLASSVKLNTTNGNVGSSVGNGYMDVIARFLGGNAHGDFIVRLPYPTNDANASATNVNALTATGAIDVRLENGDLLLGLVNGSGAANFVANNGSIQKYTGFDTGNTSAASLQLTASGAIGTDTTALALKVPGPITASAAAGGVYFANNIGTSDTSLLTINAAGPIGITSTGGLTAGAINAGANGVTLGAAGSVLDDGDAATRIAGSSVNITAGTNGSVGSSGVNGAALGVSTAALTVSAGRDIVLDDNLALSTLSLTNTSNNTNVYSVTAPGLTFSATDGGSIALDDITSTGPLALTFAAQRTLLIGAINTNGGSAILSSAQGSILDDGDGASSIHSTQTALTAANSIGASGANGAIAVDAAVLGLKSGGDFYVADSSALNGLGIESTSGGASTFALTATGQTLTITDDGTTQRLQTIAGPGLVDFQFTSAKNVNIGTVTATGTAGVKTTGNQKSIQMDGVGGSRISAGAVTLDAGGSAGGAIGTSGTPIAVGTAGLTVHSSGNVYIADNQSLFNLTLDAHHSGTDNYAASITANNISSFSVADGNTVALNNIAATALNFNFTSDRAIQVGTINVGSGTVALTTNAFYSSQTGVNPSIVDDGNQGTRITASAVSLTATNSRSYVGAGGSGDIDVSTNNLSVTSGGDVYVTDNTTLTNLALDVRHTESGDRTYAVAASGLTFQVADQSLVTGGQGTAINNVTDSGLNFAFKTDRTLQIGTINTGVNTGTVTLTAGSIQDDANNSTKITSDQLTLNGGNAGAPTPSLTTEIDTNINKLNANLTQSLYLINDNDLILGASTVTTNAVITSLNGSIFADGAAVFQTTNLGLNAINGSLGDAAAHLQLQTKTLALSNGYDVYIDSLDDLSTLSVNNVHTAVRTNTLSITGKNLTFNVVDNGGNQYDLINVTDATGIDFAFTGDKQLRVGAIDVKSGNTLSLTANGVGSSIIDDGNSSTNLIGAVIALTTSASIGDAVNPITAITTNLQLTTNGDINVVDPLDLGTLLVRSTQAGATPGSYTLVAPNLTFQIADDGTATTVANISDTTGLNFSLDTRHSQVIDTIDVQPYGTASLLSYGDIAGIGSPTSRITAATAAFETIGGGAIGTLAGPIELTAPQVVLHATGDININSNIHIDDLAIYNSHPGAGFGTYAINSPDLTFNVTDGAGGVNIADITDTTGLTLTYLSDHDMTIGTIDLGIAGDVSLGSYNDATMDLLGDGDANTAIHAVGVTLNSAHGAVGATGIGNGIDVVAQHLSAYAGGGGVFTNLGTDTVIDNITANAGSEIDNPGDIRLGNIDMNGSDLTVNSGGSILSGTITDTALLTLNAAGSIGSETTIRTNANGQGTTTLVAHAGAGGVSLQESYGLVASDITATGDVDLTSRDTLSVGTIDAGTGIVTLESQWGDIAGVNGSNHITGSEVALTADYGQGIRSIGSGGTPLNTTTQKLALDARGNMVVNNGSTDLDALSIHRTTTSNGNSAGTLTVSAQNLTFNVVDNGSLTTINNVSDSTGLDFTFISNDGLAVNTINVGNTSAVVLDSSIYNGDASILSTGGGTITAGDLTLTTHSSTVAQSGSIGTAGTALRTAVGTLTATAQRGGIFVAQTGNVLLKNLQSDGALTVTSSSGDMSIGTIAYSKSSPTAQALNLTAAGGSMLDDGDLNTAITTTGNAAVNLTAANGFGTQLTPLVINANSAAVITANVSGAGAAHLEIDATGAPVVNVTASNGAIDLRANGNQTLASLVSTTDAVGNNVVVTGTSGDVTVGTVRAGAQHGLVDLSGGRILGRDGANTVSGFTVGLNADGGIGTSVLRLNVTGQNIVAFTDGGNVYLAPTATAVLGYVQTHGGLVDIAGTADIVAGNIVTDGGDIKLVTSGSGARIFAGNVDAGSGNLVFTATNGSIIDDGLLNTFIVGGGTADFTAATGIGTSIAPLQTKIGTVNNATVTGTGGIFIAADDAIALNTLSTHDGAITITAPGRITGAGSIGTGGSGNISITSASDDVLLTNTIATAGGDANNAKVTLSGRNLSVGAVTSVGDQHYIGDALTIGGDLAGRSVLIDGDLTLGGSGTRTINTSTLGGNVDIGGDIAGAGHGLTVNAGAGDATLTGEGTNLGAVAITASDIDVHSMAGTGTQTYTGNVTFNSSYSTNGGNFVVVGPVAYTSDLGVDTAGGLVSFSSTVDGPGAIAIDAATGNVTFTGAVGGTTRVGAVTVDTAGLTTFTGAVRAASVATDIPGTLTITAPTVDTTGTQSWGENLTLNNNKNFIGTTVTFHGDVDATTNGGQALTVTGNAVFDQNVGDNVALNNVVVTGNVTFGGRVATTTTQSYTGTATLVGDTVLDVGSGGLTFNSTVSGPHALTVNAGNAAVTFAGAVGDATTRLGDLAVNTGGATTFGGNVYATSIATDVPGTVALNADIFNTTGTQTYGENVVLNRNIAFAGSSVEFTGTVNDSGAGQHALNITGNAVFNDTVGVGTALQAVNVSGIATINGGTVTSTTAQQYGGLILGDDTVLNAPTVGVTGPVDGVVPNQQSLTINGNATIAGAIGASVPLEALTINGNASLGGSVSTGTGQNYNGALVLIGDTVLDAASGGVNFAGTVDGTHALTVNAGSDAVTFNQAVGGTTRLGALTVNTAGLTTFGDVHAASIFTDGAGSILLNGSTMDTTGPQTYGENILLGHDIAFVGDTVRFQGVVDDATPGTHTLNVTGNAVFDDAIGGTTALRNVVVTGNATLNNGNITTTENQNYGSLTLGADSTLTGSAVTVAGATDGDAAGRNLTVNGAANFGGTVGGVTPLQTLTVSGPTHLNGGVITDGLQNYGGAITLDGDSVLTVGSGGLALNVAVDGPHALTVNTGTDDATFNAPIGATSRLGALTVNSSGATTFNNTVRAASVTTDFGGTVALNGGSVDTTGAQIYGDAATLGANTTLKGSAVNFLGLLDGPFALNIAGNALFAESVGGITAPLSIAVSGATAFNGGSVTTAGNQSYGGPATLGGNTTLRSNVGSIVFGSSLQGNNAPLLNLQTPRGGVTVAGALGSADQPLGRIVVTSGGANNFGSIDAAEFTLATGTGPTAFNGLIHTASGFTITGPSPVYLGANLAVDNGPIYIDGRLTLPRGALRITTNGDITLHGVDGRNTDLRMAAGLGYIRAGIPGAGPEDQVALKSLRVDSAIGAEFFGTLGGRGGVIPATRVRGGLFGDPYFFNGTPWGPLELVDTLAVQSARQAAKTINRYAQTVDQGDTGEFANGGIIQDLVAQRSDDLLTVLPLPPSCKPYERTDKCEVHTVAPGRNRL